MRVSSPTPTGFGVAPMYACVALWCTGTAALVSGIAIIDIKNAMKTIDLMVFFKIFSPFSVTRVTF
jgi:hypothetical protein